MGCDLSRGNRYASHGDMTGAGGEPAERHHGGHKSDHAKGGGASHVQQLSPLFTDPLFDVTALGSDTPHSFAVACDDGRLGVFDWSTPTSVSSWRGHSKSVNRLSFGSSVGLLASASRDTTVKLWRVGTEIPVSTLSGHSLTVSSVDFSSDNKLLCSGSRDTSVRLWDVETGRETARNSTQLNVVTDIKWLLGPLSTVVAQASEDLCVKLWDTRTPGVLKLADKLAGYVYFPLCMDVSLDGNYLLTSSKGFNSVGCEARLWDLRTMTEVCQFSGHEFDTVACAFLPTTIEDGCDKIITASKDGTIRVWDRKTAECVLRHQDDMTGSYSGLAVLPSLPNATTNGGVAGDGNSGASQLADPVIVATTITAGIYVYRYETKANRLVCLAKAQPTAIV